MYKVQPQVTIRGSTVLLLHIAFFFTLAGRLLLSFTLELKARIPLLLMLFLTVKKMHSTPDFRSLSTN